MSIYRPCDIRGNATDELTPALYEQWGKNLGRQLPETSKFVVGGDCRASTPTFLEALADGLAATGLDVVDVGLLPTPMIYYAKQRLKAEGCAIVTASHNPAEINGLKWMLHDRPPTPEEVAAMSAEIEPGGRSRRENSPRQLDVSFDYVATLQETFVESLGAHRHVVIDPMHGSWAVKARHYLHAIFPQCLFDTIHDEPAADFGGRTPDCSRADELGELGEAVYRQRAHFGVAFDGDGDRLALVDNEGVALSPEETVWVLMNCLGAKLCGERFVHDLKYSDRIIEVAKQFGAETVVERSGHAFIRTKMNDSGAVFGAEISGHYFHRVLGGGEDGLFTTCLLIEHLARTGHPLSELRRECPAVFMTPDLRVSLPADRQARIIEQARAAWSEFPQNTLDGVKISIPGGWALVRSSVTEPALTFRFEGLDWHALEDLVERFCDSLPEVGDEIWAKFQGAMGGG